MNPGNFKQMTDAHFSLRSSRDVECTSADYYGEKPSKECNILRDKCERSAITIGQVVLAGRRQGGFQELKYDSVAETALKSEGCQGMLMPFWEFFGAGPRQDCKQLLGDLTHRVDALADDIYTNGRSYRLGRGRIPGKGGGGR